MTSTMLPNGHVPLTEPPSSDPTLQIDLLIVGAGPAGSSLACFLAAHSLTGLLISTAPGTAKEPRAHITNPAALECLRDIGLEEECQSLATPGDCMRHTRWCHSMAGEEYARIYSWGNAPDRMGDYAAASPCRHVDLPQTLLEPALVKAALKGGWKVRFDTTFVSFARESSIGPITSTLKDNITGAIYTVKSKYLFGADGARSQIIRQLDIPLAKEPGQGLAINVLVEADMSHLVEHRQGNLHYTVQPEVQHPRWSWFGNMRMVKAWHEWLFIMLCEPGYEPPKGEPSKEDALKRVKEFIGDDSIPAKVMEISRWNINEVVASRYSDGNIFCLGDAVHRHPPFNGLGSNTCIQDAFNLSWKIAYVTKGLADPSLLDTYSEERQPIGKAVITRANQGLRDHAPVWEALGAADPDVEERKKQHAELSAPTVAGRQRREKLRKGVEGTAHEFLAIGVEMNQQYQGSAVYLMDEVHTRRAMPEDPVLQYQITTYPGSRVPHAWINTSIPGKPISTVDLAGHGAFCVLTGLGGEKWKEAAKETSKELGVDINAYTIGWRCDYEDVYGDWAKRREVEEDGCVLTRPDRTVCWRSTDVGKASKEKLVTVIKAILGRK